MLFAAYVAGKHARIQTIYCCFSTIQTSIVSSSLMLKSLLGVDCFGFGFGFFSLFPPVTNYSQTEIQHNYQLHWSCKDITPLEKIPPQYMVIRKAVVGVDFFERDYHEYEPSRSFETTQKASSFLNLRDLWSRLKRTVSCLYQDERPRSERKKNPNHLLRGGKDFDRYF